MITLTRGEALAIAGMVLGVIGVLADPNDTGKLDEIAVFAGIVLFWFGALTSNR